jgi:hypothetical protein
VRLKETGRQENFDVMEGSFFWQILKDTAVKAPAEGH